MSVDGGVRGKSLKRVISLWTMRARMGWGYQKKTTGQHNLLEHTITTNSNRARDVLDVVFVCQNFSSLKMEVKDGVGMQVRGRWWLRGE